MAQSRAYRDIINTLNLQKEHLGISYVALAEKTGLAQITIKRILSGKNGAAHFMHMLSLAEALGVNLAAKVVVDAESMRREQAEKKAKVLMKLVRGNSALEGQSLAPVAYKRMLEKTVQDLLSGPRKKLWAE